MLNNWFALLCTAIYSLDNYMTSEKKDSFSSGSWPFIALLAQLYLGSDIILKIFNF